MADRPPWLKVGAPVVIYQATKWDSGAAMLTKTTVDRIGKRDVVCANGERFNVDHLQRRTGSWSSPVLLLDIDDPRVARASVVNRIIVRRSVVHTVYEEWRRKPDDLAVVDALTEALEDYRSALYAKHQEARRG